MKSNLVTLPTARRSSIVCKEAGIVFPQVFRITGHPFKFKEGKGGEGCFFESMDDLETDFDLWATPTYTLDSARTYSDLAKTFITPVEKLDNKVDDGWVIVRFHPNEEALDGYVDGMIDTRTKAFEERFMTFNTQFGIFSILRRPATPGTPTCVLIYTTKIKSKLGPIDWYTIIDSSGKVLDPNDLEQPEDKEHFAPLHNALNPR